MASKQKLKEKIKFLEEDVKFWQDLYGDVVEECDKFKDRAPYSELTKEELIEFNKHSIDLINKQHETEILDFKKRISNMIPMSNGEVYFRELYYKLKQDMEKVLDGE